MIGVAALESAVLIINAHTLMEPKMMDANGWRRIATGAIKLGKAAPTDMDPTAAQTSATRTIFALGLRMQLTTKSIQLALTAHG